MLFVPLDALIDYLQENHLGYDDSPEQKILTEIVDSILEFADNFAVEGSDTL